MLLRTVKNDFLKVLKGSGLVVKYETITKLYLLSTVASEMFNRTKIKRKFCCQRNSVNSKSSCYKSKWNLTSKNWIHVLLTRKYF